MKYTKKMNKLERSVAKSDRKEHALKGCGLYLYRNNTNGDLHLTKPSTDGRRVIGRGQEFKGDNYFMQFIGKDLRLITVINTPEQEKIVEELKTEMLILDQPQKVTNQGTVENVVKKTDSKFKKKVSKNKIQENKEGEVLLIDGAIEGVEIIV